MFLHAGILQSYILKDFEKGLNDKVHIKITVNNKIQKETTLFQDINKFPKIMTGTNDKEYLKFKYFK